MFALPGQMQRNSCAIEHSATTKSVAFLSANASSIVGCLSLLDGRVDELEPAAQHNPYITVLHLLCLPTAVQHLQRLTDYLEYALFLSVCCVLFVAFQA